MFGFINFEFITMTTLSSKPPHLLLDTWPLESGMIACQLSQPSSNNFSKPPFIIERRLNVKFSPFINKKTFNKITMWIGQLSERSQRQVHSTGHYYASISEYCLWRFLEPSWHLSVYCSPMNTMCVMCAHFWTWIWICRISQWSILLRYKGS